MSFLLFFLLLFCIKDNSYIFKVFITDIFDAVPVAFIADHAVARAEDIFLAVVNNLCLALEEIISFP